MDSYEDDDDTHFCIKCHLTIHGLENYVRHRQSGCRSPDDKNETVPTTPTTVSYPEILNADAFFSSLELQSSSKSNPRRATTLLEDSRKFKKDEKRKKGQKRQMDAEESTMKEKLHSMLPGVSELEDPTDHLCMPSLVGFPDIVSTTASKPTVTSSRSKLSQSMNHSTSIENSAFSPKHEPENSLEGLMTSHVESKQTNRKRQEESQRMEQVHQTWLDDTILAELAVNNENKDLTKYEFEYQQDEDSEDDILEEDLVEDESYSESDDGEDHERPPHGHTGGKWKPELDDLPQNMSQLQDDDVEPEDEHQEHPPPTYTGGKWRPSDPSHKLEEYESKSSGGQPPPGHTRGKWVPGAQTDIESGYWCSPCGRKLASRLVYNRHLLSDLHARRSIREIDGVLCLPRAANVYTAKKTSTRNQKIKELPETKDVKKRLRRREKEILSCEMCHARVKRAQMGKHLLSHYHCRVAGVNPRGPRARRFLLENMANVVRQCPFQCFSCRFYCNTEEAFLRHWRSELHARTLEQIAGSYKCTPCDFWCEENKTMETHLLSPSHRDVVSMMNGSVPIVIGRQRALPCGSCDRRFQYNLQLRLHIKETGHKESLTATDEYQQRIKCNLCSQIVRSLIALQRHQLSCHSDKTEKEEANKSSEPARYYCSFCTMNFTTAKEAVLHRRTSSHKEIVRARKNNQDSSIATVRECPHCVEKQPNLSEHKKHLLYKHPELCHRCPKCGTLFALSQDVSRHTKENKCRGDNKLNEVKTTSVKDEEWRCGSCGFSTDSQAEYIFHEALHDGIVQNDNDDTVRGKSLPKYSCPVCKKAFAKGSLRNHIRNHTGERPFPCAKCLASFSRRSDLSAHQKGCTGSATDCSSVTGRKRIYVCSECNDAFYTKHALRQHILRHAGKKYKCGLPGCPTVLRTASELKSHRSLVHENSVSSRRYKCSDCTYAAKTKTQLRRHHASLHNEENDAKAELHACPYSECTFRTKLDSHLQRHIRLHTGTKPYQCRHCSYASNNLENLRKHVLSTSLHPGKTIYECDVCRPDNQNRFQTNFAKELRAHLMEAHSDLFPTPGHAYGYVFGIFETHRNTAFVDASSV
ncbi:zinc finger protein 845-like [Ceratina calcarata]|uniref:Zinc finger protein 845-like n=1 Tax=Ceratina calcarata TaxID=156304 RepID=A0AAJ7SBY8_9HYME|nr:zinc finger protein 845-like [Ceratina calcarata]XP_026675227.1 zinc finger protein 845-like [Ceratina calcarata]